jgi:hypothetical protein
MSHPDPPFIDARFSAMEIPRAQSGASNPKNMGEMLGPEFDWRPAFPDTPAGGLPSDIECAVEVDVGQEIIKTLRRRDEFTGETREYKLKIKSGNGPVLFREEHLRSRWDFSRETGCTFPLDVQQAWSDGGTVPGMAIGLGKHRAIIFDACGLPENRELWERARRKAIRIVRYFHLRPPEETRIFKFKGAADYWGWCFALRCLVDGGVWPGDTCHHVRAISGLHNLPSREVIAESRQCPIPWQHPALRAEFAADMRARAAKLPGGSEKYSEVNVITPELMGTAKEPGDFVTPVPRTV